MEKFDWECLYYFNISDNSRSTKRAKVPGGWVLLNVEKDENVNFSSQSMVFIPDEKHEWKT